MGKEDKDKVDEAKADEAKADEEASEAKADEAKADEEAGEAKADEAKADKKKASSNKTKGKGKTKGKTKGKPKAAAREATSDPPPEPKDDAPHDDHGHHKPDRKKYLQVFFWLFVLTVLEVGVAYLEAYMGKTALVTALIGLALAKAAAVAMFFMHLNHETKFMRWTVAFPMAFPALYAFILIAEGAYRAIWGGS